MGSRDLRLGRCGHHRDVLQRPVHVGGIVGEQVGKIVGRERSAAQHVHGVVRPHDDAVVAVFRAAGDHLLIAIGHQHGEQNRTHVAVGRVPAREGWAVDQVHDGAAVIDVVAGRNIEVVRSHDRQDRGLGLKRTGIPESVGAGSSGRSAIGCGQKDRARRRHP